MVLNGKRYRDRKDEWKGIGLDGSVGRTNKIIDFGPSHYKDGSDDGYTSKFDPVLMEHVFKWFCPDGGTILDPLCGGPTAGVVAGMLGYRFNGIDLRSEQIEANEDQVNSIFSEGGMKPQYHCGDCLEVMDGLTDTFDLVVSSPPYYDLAKYNDSPDNLCNKASYEEFTEGLGKIIRKSAGMLKMGGFMCLLMGDVRDKDGHYRGLVSDTIRMAQSAGLDLFNEMIVVQPYASAPMRAATYIKRYKVPRVHLHLLVFGKMVEVSEKMKRKISKYSKRLNRNADELWKELNRM